MTKLLTFTSIAVVLSSSLFPVYAADQVLHLVPTKVPGCMKFVNPRGGNWKALGMMGVSGSSCPSEFNGKQTVQTTLIDAHSAHLATGQTCVFDDTGAGKCN